MKYLLILALILCILAWYTPQLPDCENDRDTSIRHGWVKQYTYAPLVLGYGVQRIETYYVTQPGKRDVHICH